jgi:hypothetical protein
MMLLARYVDMAELVGANEEFADLDADDEADAEPVEGRLIVTLGRVTGFSCASAHC